MVVNQDWEQEKVHTHDIDGLRNSDYISAIKEWVKKNVDTICNLTQKNQIYGAIDKYFSPGDRATKGINSFLREHPHVYTDLIRVIHTFRTKDGKFPEDKIPDIKQIFLFRWRTADAWKYIPWYIDQILENKKFIQYGAKCNSILDIGSYDFSMSIDEKRRTSIIRKLIAAGMIENMEWCTIENIDDNFLYTKGRILHYLWTIFWIYLCDIEWVQTLDDLTQELSKLFWSGHGNDRKKAWKVVQAFHAWGDISNIEKQYAQSRKACEDMSNKLQAVGINLDKDMIKRTTNHQGAEIWNAQWNYKGTIMHVSWRAKTPKSILKKLWETAEYVRWSAVRDEIGLSFTYPDETSSEIKTEIGILWSLLLAKQWYIFKNKWEFNKDEFSDIMSKTKKTPLSIDNKPWADPKMCNASQSGFTRIWSESFGFEIQYSRKSAMEWKKQDDPIYKLKWSIDALIRWKHQASPKEIFDNLTREIKEDDFRMFWVSSYNELMKKLIKGFNNGKGIIFPYIWLSQNKTPIVLFTTKAYKKAFEKKWNMRVLTKEDLENYQKMLDLVDGFQQTH